MQKVSLCLKTMDSCQ